jgi:hypothetical protein
MILQKILVSMEKQYALKMILVVTMLVKLEYGKRISAGKTTGLV